jgi:hypothetical protein
MTDKILGTLRTVDPREVWSHEAHEFTPWLAENLNLLSSALDIDIDLEGTERSVGNFAVDIEGRVAGTDHKVVIENQLAPTDHSHLGQLLTYAAGIDARIVVWVTPKVRDEHRQAVDWLNRQTPDTVSFFAVEIKLLKIDGSAPAPQLSVVAGPSQFQREAVSAPRSPREAAFEAFFKKVIDTINTLKPGYAKANSPGYGGWISLGIGRVGFGIAITITRQNVLRVEIYIGSENRERNRRALRQLRAHESDLNSAFQGPLHWEQLPRDCRVSLVYDRPVDPMKPPPESVDWAAETAIRFRDQFGPLIESLDLESAMDDEATPDATATEQEI